MRVLTFLILLALPGPLGAQAGPGPSQPARVGSAAALFLKGSEVAQAGRAHLGGWAGLVFGQRLVVGGAGMALLERVDLVGSLASTGFDLGMGYGGLLVRYLHPLPLGFTGEAGVLLGAGHADMRDRLGGRNLGSDNFWVAEPEVALSYPLYRSLFLSGSLGYRTVWGLEKLPTVADTDLKSLTASVALRIGGG